MKLSMNEENSLSSAWSLYITFVDINTGYVVDDWVISDRLNLLKIAHLCKDNTIRLGDIPYIVTSSDAYHQPRPVGCRLASTVLVSRIGLHVNPAQPAQAKVEFIVMGHARPGPDQARPDIGPCVPDQVFSIGKSVWMSMSLNDNRQELCKVVNIEFSYQTQLATIYLQETLSDKELGLADRIISLLEEGLDSPDQTWNIVLAKEIKKWMVVNAIC